MVPVMLIRLPYLSTRRLRDSIYQSLLELSTEEGIYASGKEEIYGCIFGRDSFLTILKILKVHSKKPDLELLQICRRSLLTLTELQGKQFNLESGEEPGKFIHEFRKEDVERFLALEKPWYVYPDGLLRNYDSIDSTPLGLIAIFKYWQTTKDGEFLMSVLPAVELALNWIITYGDKDKDQLLEYTLPDERNHGGLSVQSWTDSHESIMQVDGRMPKYPIAPVEAQAYAWLALRLWAQFYLNHSSLFAKKLLKFASQMKKHFNQLFILEDQGLYFAAQALEGDKKQIKTITGNPLICLWATFRQDDIKETILEDRYIADFAKRIFLSDMFDPGGRVRTMSALSATYNSKQNSYHNGSFWPKLNGLAHEGLFNWGYAIEAELLRHATLKPIEFFGSPIELYTKTIEGEYLLYQNNSASIA